MSNLDYKQKRRIKNTVIVIAIILLLLLLLFIFTRGNETVEAIGPLDNSTGEVANNNEIANDAIDDANETEDDVNGDETDDDNTTTTTRGNANNSNGTSTGNANNNNSSGTSEGSANNNNSNGTSTGNNDNNNSNGSSTEEKTKPTFSLKGNTDITVEYKGTFEDPGIEIKDGTVTTEVYFANTASSETWKTVEGVDTDSLGVYRICYTIFDNDGKKVETLIRIVSVNDTVAPTVKATVSTEANTNKDVTVTIKSSEALKEIAGWTKVDDTTYTKIFTANVEETITVEDLAGNKTEVSYKVEGIDKVVPTATVNTSNNNGGTPVNTDVTATLVASEPIKDIEGWTRVSETTFTKVYSENVKPSVEIEDLAGNKQIIKFEVKRIDKVPPKLTVVSPNKYQMEINTPYVEKGYSAWDVVDKDLTSSVVKTYQFQAKGTSQWPFVDELDTSKLGTYKVIYTVTDKNGNTSEGTRVVEIVDTTAPVATSLRIVSNGLSTGNSSNKIYYARVGNTINVYAHFEEELYELPKLKINGTYETTLSSVLRREGYNIYYKTIKLSETDGIADGLVNIEVYGYADESGNVGKTLTNADFTLASQSKVIVDKTNPTTEVKERIGKEPNYSGMSFKLKDNISIDYFEVNGKKYDRTNAKSSDANYQNIKSSLVNGENTLVLYDVAGNSTTYTFILERIAPTITVSDGTVGEGPYSKLNLKMHDASGIASIVINGTKLPHTGYWVDINDGHAYTFLEGENTVVVTDNAGNVTTQTFVVDRANHINSFDDLKAAFEKGGKIKLASDIVVEETLIQKAGINIDLDMNGKKITLSNDFKNDAVFDMKLQSALTISGNGTIDLENHVSVIIFIPRGNLTINDGTYRKNYDPNYKLSLDKWGNENNYMPLIAGINFGGADKAIRGKTIINGGYFDGGLYDSTNSKMINSTINLSWGHNFKVYGGTFVGYNPALGDEANGNQGYFLEGQTAVNEIPAGYTIAEGDKLADGRPTFTVEYNK